MITIINGSEKFLIESEIKKIIKENGVDTMNIIEYDGDDKSFVINDLVNDCLTLPFFSDKKVVILKNPKFFKANKKSDDTQTIKEEINYDSFLRYCANPVYETELIIYSYDFNFNKALKLYKQVSKNANVKNFNSLSPDEFRAKAYNLVKREEIVIDEDAMRQLILNSNGQLWLLIENIKKLKLYGERVDLKAVNKLTDAYLEDKSYELSSAIFNRQVDQAIKIYRDLIASDVNVFMLNAVLANTIRLMHEVNYYMNEHYADKDILKLTALQPGRLYFLKKELTKYRNANFLKMLSLLSEIDEQLKSNSSLEKEERFEILLINLMREN